LQRTQLEQVLEIELKQVQKRVLETAKQQFVFRITEAARNFLLQEGTNMQYGARHLKRAIERHVVYPLANLLSTEQIHLGDVVCIDLDGSSGQLAFRCEGTVSVPPMAVPPALFAAQAASALGGIAAEQPAAARAAEQPVAAPLPVATPAALPSALNRRPKDSEK